MNLLNQRTPGGTGFHRADRRWFLTAILGDQAQAEA